MAKYDYQCKACSEIFEAEHGFDHDSPIPCPTCQSKDTSKVILTVPGIYFNWWNANAASKATLPRYLGPVQRQAKTKKQRHRAMKEEEKEYGENYGI